MATFVKVLVAVISNAGTIYQIMEKFVDLVDGSDNKERLREEIKLEVKKEVARICNEKSCAIEHTQS